MNETFQMIHEYWLKKGLKEEDLVDMESTTVDLSVLIMEYAHRKQKRENGEDYAEHPTRVLKNYRKLINIGVLGDKKMDQDLLEECGVPFLGVQEVCLLHDVLEDTPLSMENLEEIFDACGYKDYFNHWVRTPLSFITHDKSVPYEEYIMICAKHPVSALVKMMDLQDNLRVVDLVKMDEKNYERAKRYLSYFYVLNQFYRYLENANKYRKEMKHRREIGE